MLISLSCNVLLNEGSWNRWDQHLGTQRVVWHMWLVKAWSNRILAWHSQAMPFSFVAVDALTSKYKDVSECFTASCSSFLLVFHDLHEMIGHPSDCFCVYQVILLTLLASTTIQKWTLFWVIHLSLMLFKVLPNAHRAILIGWIHAIMCLYSYLFVDAVCRTLYS
jgi:hypothetical protein